MSCGDDNICKLWCFNTQNSEDFHLPPIKLSSTSIITDDEMDANYLGSAILLGKLRDKVN